MAHTKKSVYAARARSSKRERDSKVLRVALIVGFFAAILFGTLIYLANTVRWF